MSFRGSHHEVAAVVRRGNRGAALITAREERQSIRDETEPTSFEWHDSLASSSRGSSLQKATEASRRSGAVSVITRVWQMPSGLRLSCRTPWRILMLREIATLSTWKRLLLPEIANENPWLIFHGGGLVHRSRRASERDRSTTFCRVGEVVVDNINQDLLKGACRRRHWQELFVPVPHAAEKLSALRSAMEEKG